MDLPVGGALPGSLLGGTCTREVAILGDNFLDQRDDDALLALPSRPEDRPNAVDTAPWGNRSVLIPYVLIPYVWMPRYLLY